VLGRLLCLDYGKKRVGIAMTDPLRMIARGVETVPAHEIREHLVKLLEGLEPDGVVVGYPKTLMNEPSEAARYIEPFLVWFRKQFPEIPLIRYDERFTSRMAERSLIDAGIPKMARRDKSLVDQVSAALILQSFLDAEQNRKPDGPDR
jgi:putative Holliday junction resolvase